MGAIKTEAVTEISLLSCRINVDKKSCYASNASN